MIVVSYLGWINLAGFLLMGIDKNRARRGAWRISEKTLFICALLGGSLGTTLGIWAFRHKTRHKQFTYGMPLILIVQVLLIYYITK